MLSDEKLREQKKFEENICMKKKRGVGESDVGVIGERDENGGWVLR